MELDWTSFILEIINFLVLVWILRRFLYRPVMKVVAQRRAAIAKTIDETQTARNEANALKEQYENRLGEWQKEREAARAKLREEVEAERAKLMAQLQDELATQRHKEQVQAERREETLLREARRQAAELSGRFAAALLARLADAALQEGLLEMLLEDLDRLPEAQRQVLTEAQRDSPLPIQVISAFPLDDGQRHRLSAALQKIGTQASCEFSADPALLAGLSVHIGAQRLQANLKEELRFFADHLRHET